MGVRFVLGRAGTGKTTLCLNEVREALRKDPCGPPMIILVPEQATFQVERALVNTPDLPGFMRAQVLSFKRLAGRVLQELGGGARRDIGDLGKLMVLRSLIRQKASELSIFAKGSERYGFAQCLAETLRELAMYRVTPEDLEARAAELDKAGLGMTPVALKLHDLAVVVRAYREYLGDKFQDPDDHLSLAASRIAHSTLTRGALVWVDGFRGFTPQEYSVLEALLCAARRVSVALCLDPDAIDHPFRDTDVFRPTRETYERLVALARELGVGVEPPVILRAPAASGAGPGMGGSTSTGVRSAPLRHLEREFGPRRPAPFKGEPHGIRLVAATNPRAEVEAAAREILRLAREDGMRFRDIGVIVGDLEAYHDLIEPIFKDHGIPFFIDRRRSVGHHPLVELVRSALDVVCEDWAYDPVFRYLKTDLVPLSRREVDLLENFVLARGIRGTRWFDDKVWTCTRASDSASGLGSDSASESGSDPGSSRVRSEDEDMTRTLGEARAKATAALAEFHHKVAACDAKPVHDMARALFELLAALGVRERLQEWAREAADAGDVEGAREHQQVWKAVLDLLDEVVQALGDQVTDVSSFRELVEAGLQGMTLGLIPPALDQVIVGSVERSRHPALRAAFVLGATYDAFPRRVSEGTVLSDREREILQERGLTLAPTSRVEQFYEQYHVYVALTRAWDRLWVSYPMADGEGRAIRPSPVTAQLKAMFPTLSEEFACEDVPSSSEKALDAITSEAKAAALVVRHFRGSLGPAKPGPHGAAGEWDPFWLDLYEWLVEDPERRQRALRVLKSLAFTNYVGKLGDDTARALYPDPVTASVSRLEAFARCPFAHFAGWALRLAERELFRLEPPGMGTFIHETLRKLVDDLGDERALAGLSDAEIDAKVARIVEELAPRLQNEILRSSARYEYIERVLTRILRRSAKVLKDHACRSEFRSVGREVAFGHGRLEGSSIPGLKLEIDDGRRLVLVGRIDRVDVAEAGGVSYLRVIDYKSSQRSLDLRDVYDGIALQLLVYLAVAEDHSEALTRGRAEPAGALYFPAADPLVSASGPVDDDDLESRRKRMLKMTGVIVGGPDVVRLMDKKIQGASDIVPARLTKDGEVAKSSGSNVIARERYRALRRFLLAKVRELSSRIVAGEVAARPYRRGKFRACQWCEFKPVCGFDILLPGNEYRDAVCLENDEFWAAVERNVSSEGDVS